MLIYVISSFYYICRTKNIGTPFNDSLTPIQRKIKEMSANIRRRIFQEGLILGIVIILILRPFKQCQ
jgi:hypothetical protein